MKRIILILCLLFCTNLAHAQQRTKLYPPNGGTGDTNVPAYSIIFGNGTLPFIWLTPGDSNFVLTSKGPGLLPYWKAVIGGLSTVYGVAPIVIHGGDTVTIGTVPFADSTLLADSSNVSATSHLLSPVPIWNQNTSGNAGTVTNGVYTTGSYSDPAWITNINYSILDGIVPTWNQNTTGTALNVSGIVAIANGGTGQVTAQAAIDSLTNASGGTSGYVWTTDATNGSWQPIGNFIYNQDTGIQTANFSINSVGSVGGWLNVGNLNTADTLRSFTQGQHNYAGLNSAALGIYSYADDNGSGASNPSFAWGWDYGDGVGGHAQNGSVAMGTYEYASNFSFGFGFYGTASNSSYSFGQSIADNHSFAAQGGTAHNNSTAFSGGAATNHATAFEGTAVNYGYAFGGTARDTNSDSFVFGPSEDIAPTHSDTSFQFVARAENGFKFYQDTSDIPTLSIHGDSIYSFNTALTDSVGQIIPASIIPGTNSYVLTTTAGVAGWQPASGGNGVSTAPTTWRQNLITPVNDVAALSIMQPDGFFQPAFQTFFNGDTTVPTFAIYNRSQFTSSSLAAGGEYLYGIHPGDYADPLNFAVFLDGRYSTIPTTFDEWNDGTVTASNPVAKVPIILFGGNVWDSTNHSAATTYITLKQVPVSGHTINPNNSRLLIETQDQGGDEYPIVTFSGFDSTVFYHAINMNAHPIIKTPYLNFSSAITDASALNNSVYTSSDHSNDIVWKDASATVHDLAAGGGSGTVTSVATDATLTGGTITTTGTLGINLANSNTWTAAQTISMAGITTSNNDGITYLTLQNSTHGSAIGGHSLYQSSPAVKFLGHAANIIGGLDTTVYFYNWNSVTGAAPPAGNLTWAFGSDAAQDLTTVAQLNQFGEYNVLTGFQVNGSAPSGDYLRGNGTDFVDGTIQAGDIPTLNQNTTGHSDSARSAGIADSAKNCLPHTLTIKLSGGGATITTGVPTVDSISIPIEYAGTITKWTVNGSPSGSIAVDIMKNGVSLVGAGNKPSLTSQTINSDQALSSWTTNTVANGDVLVAKVSSVSSVQTCYVTLFYH